MADAARVNISKSAKELVREKFDLERRHHRFELAKVPGGAVDRLGHILLDKIKIDFACLCIYIRQRKERNGKYIRQDTVALTRSPLE